MDVYKFWVLLLVAPLLLAVAAAHASSVSASFNVINSSVGINQNILFNISAYYTANSSYTVFLNGTPVLSGNLPADYSGYTTAGLNVSNMLFGYYAPCIKFSFITGDVCSNSSFYISPSTNFGFIGYSNYTLLYNSHAALDLSVLNSGNTPINISWSVPNLPGIHFALFYIQDFTLMPGKLESIPINITSTSSNFVALNFSFLANFSSVSIRKNYVTTLVSPYVNINFTGFNVVNQINRNESEYQINFSNSNNVPINVTFEFKLCIPNGGQCNVFFYNKSFMISPFSKRVNVTLPNSSVLSVNALYPSSNGSLINTQIFSGPAPQSGTVVNPLLSTSDVAYIVLTGVIIAVIAFLHIRAKRSFPKSGGKR